eukprot:CAMPEP_0198653524 /NCGR_PEP_ID=MMETSP1467-20131203/7120_1 /TAXON_ID=1462469 /ORGANISM="unid. sp., Strain CCMP2135" /LENGTH=57 /DNA_ID=CAMNT_0044389489 /DNA_START=77 /DNA_END=247 /DNA_ORIENTATION=-
MARDSAATLVAALKVEVWGGGVHHDGAKLESRLLAFHRERQKPPAVALCAADVRVLP